MVYDVMLVFVTVGSTQFDTLVQAVLSKPILRCLSRKGYSCLVVQCGTSDLDYARSVRDAGITFHEEDVQIEIWRFKPSLQTEYERAHLVISHAGAFNFFFFHHIARAEGAAGSGTILDVLRHGKPLIVVPNPSLLDNHQQELASSLAQRGHLATSSVQ